MLDIIITTYNNPNQLDKALSSIYAQTNLEFKVTIVDDASNEDYSNVIESYKDKFDITYLKNSENLGPGLSRQIGVDNSNEDYFIFLDSDDRLMPYTVQLIKDLLKTYNYPDWLICPFYTQTFEIYKKATRSASTILTGQDTNKLLTWHHGKVYKRKSIEDSHIKIPKEFSRITDDYYYNVMCAVFLDRQISTNISYYLWVQDKSSITHTRSLQKDEMQDKVISALLDIGAKAIEHNRELGYVENQLKAFVTEENKPKIKDKKLIEKIEEFLSINNL